MIRQDVIVQLFKERGGLMTTAGLAHACIEERIFDADELDKAALRLVQGVCREALKQSNEYGLPFAGPSSEKSDDGDSRLWKQLDLWGYEDYEYNIHERNSGLLADHTILARIRDHCMTRYGKAPAILEIDKGLLAHA